MFADIKLLPPDPILGLTKAYQEDPRTKKIDLGVGVFRTLDGRTPVMKAVSQAQAIVDAGEKTKSYTAGEGAAGFASAILNLVFGADSDIVKSGRAAAVQAPGGSGSLMLAGGVLKRAGAQGISIGDPTWPNHKPLLSAAGVEISMIPYYDHASASIDFEAFHAAVKELGPKDVLLLHGGCHNPTGSDLTKAQIDTLADTALDRGFLPLIDFAYHGFATDLESDAYMVREFARRLPEVLITYSCSKNFGLYRERTGAFIAVGPDADRANAVKSHAINVARTSYSLPPAHGGLIVAEILNSPELSKMWRDELTEMCATVRGNRRLIVETAEKIGLGNRLSFIQSQNGMFSLMPITPDEVKAIIEKHGVYMTSAGRINLCGVNANNVEHLVSAYRDVTGA